MLLVPDRLTESFDKKLGRQKPYTNSDYLQKKQVSDMRPQSKFSVFKTRAYFFGCKEMKGMGLNGDSCKEINLNYKLKKAESCA